jgi:hypothetical protein
MGLRRWQKGHFFGLGTRGTNGYRQCTHFAGFLIVRNIVHLHVRRLYYNYNRKSIGKIAIPDRKAGLVS